MLMVKKNEPKKVPLAEKLMHNFQNPKLYRAYAAKLFRLNPKVYRAYTAKLLRHNPKVY